MKSQIIENYMKERIKKAKLRHVRNEVNKIIEFLKFIPKELEDINYSDLSIWLNSKRNVSLNTRYEYLTYVKRFLDYCYKKGFIKNPLTRG